MARQETASGPSHGRLVLFDFDGTITTKDTLIEVVKYYRGKRAFWWGMAMLAPLMAMHVLKIIPNWKAKQIFLARFFKGEPVDQFDARCQEFSRKILPSLIRPEALTEINDHKAEGATIAVVSASAENWIKPWCDEMGLECLGTRLEVRDGCITGLISGKNCYGDEKVCRIRERFETGAFKEIIAYGDTSGDREMLAMAHTGHYKPFRKGWVRTKVS